MATKNAVHLWTEPTGRVVRQNGLNMPQPDAFADRQSLLDDMTSIYEGNPRAHFKDVGEAIRDLGTEAGWSGLQDAKRTTRMLRKFANSQLGQQIGEVAGDPAVAARMALEMLYWAGVNRNQQQDRGGGTPTLGEAMEGAGIPANGEASHNGMGDAMKEALEEAAAAIKQEMGIGQGDSDQGQDGDQQGNGWGDSDQDFEGFEDKGQKGSSGGSNMLRGLGRGAHIKPLIQRLMLKYERARTNHFQREESIMPEDDIDLRPARIGEIPYIMDLIGHDDDMFYNKYVKGELSTLRHWKVHTEELSRTYAMAIDVSGSMSDRAGSFTAADYAIASAIALLENALKGGNKVKIMFFDSNVSNAHSGTPAQMVQMLLSTPFSGGGTDIDAALNALDNAEYDEAIMITDGGDTVYRKHPIQVPLYTIFVGGGDNAQLAKLSRSYERVKKA